MKAHRYKPKAGGINDMINRLRWITRLPVVTVRLVTAKSNGTSEPMTLFPQWYDDASRIHFIASPSDPAWPR
jgi:hypothetical protein